MRIERSAEEVEQVKQKILEGALNLIISKGFNALSMRGLARDLGMSAPNLYNYFKNKDEIYITLMIQGFHRLRDSLAAAAVTEEKPIDKARALLHAYLKFALSESHYYELMFSVRAPKYNDFQGTEMEPLSRQEHQLSMAVVQFADQSLNTLALSLGVTLAEPQRRQLLIEQWSLLHGLAGLHFTGNSHYLVDKPIEVYRQLLDDYLDNWVSRIKYTI